jgi:membrane-bound ClpP family serine protease
MLILGIVLILLALLIPALSVLFWVGVVLAVCGAVLLALSYTRGGPRFY